MEPVIQLEKLTKRYGSRRGIVDLSLEVYPGEVLGYLGPNGAGKSTTIRLLLDMIRPSGGRARVLGLDPRADAVALHRRVGYLAGDFVVHKRQSVRECLSFLSGLRGGVPAARIDELAQRLDLDLSARIKSLSKGNRQKVGLVQAFMHQPELFILDEPTSGLDPLVQQTFLDLVREARAAGQTILMSSHIMSEVEAVADRVAIIRDGRLVAVSGMAELRSRTALTVQVEIEFTTAPNANRFAVLEGVTDVTVEGCTLRCRAQGSPDALIKLAAEHTVRRIRAVEPDLEDLFLGYYSSEEKARVA